MKYWVAYGVQTLPINVSTINSKRMHVLYLYKEEFHVQLIRLTTMERESVINLHH